MREQVKILILVHAAFLLNACTGNLATQPGLNSQAVSAGAQDDTRGPDVAGTPIPSRSSTPAPTATPKPAATPTPTPTPSGPQVFVSPTGSDSNSGTAQAPFKTIQKGINAATPGTTVRVAPGIYNEIIYARVSGTASKRIRIVSDVKHGAKIRPSGGAENIFRNGGSYVDIEGFEVDGSNHLAARVGLYAHGSYVRVKDVYVHHIHHKGTCTNQGAAGVLGEGYYGDVEVDVVNSTIHDVGPAGCTFDQGIYHTGSGKILNNVVYRVSACGLHLWHDPRNIVMANNTVFNNATGICMGGGDFYNTTKTPGDYISVINNIVYDNDLGVWAGGTLGNNNVYKNNLLYKNDKDWSLGKGTPVGTIAAEPQFVNYQRDGGGDYRLRASSPAINAGVASDAPNFDFEGASRPAGGAVDIGAFEYR